MAEENFITPKIIDQILQVRDTGVCNMFSFREVQRAAYDMELYDLVMFIEDHRMEYLDFILHGKRTDDEKDAQN